MERRVDRTHLDLFSECDSKLIIAELPLRVQGREQPTLPHESSVFVVVRVKR